MTLSGINFVDDIGKGKFMTASVSGNLLDPTAIPAFKISTEEFERIIKTLPKELDPEKLDLLKYILHVWCNHDLREHYLGTRDTAPEDLKQVKKIAQSSRKLIAALNNPQPTQAISIVEFAIRDQRKTLFNRAEKEKLKLEFSTWQEMLIEIESAAQKAQKIFKQRKGHADKTFGYLVMLDLAELYKFATDTKPTRIVDRKSGKETGPFYDFARLIWPMIKGSGSDGFATAYNDWGKESKKHHESSALIANIFMRC